MTGAPPRVFISYSHDTVAHQERVLALADRLRADGIDAEIDQYHPAPAEGWPLWCKRQIAAADCVLMVCTESYRRRVSGDEEPGKGHGVKGLGVVWEARIIRQLLYDAGTNSEKFAPVLFAEASPEQIPTPVKGWTRYVVDTEDGYEDLYRRLTGQPRLLRPALGTIRPLPPLRRQWHEGTAPGGARPSATEVFFSTFKRVIISGQAPNREPTFVKADGTMELSPDEGSLVAKLKEAARAFEACEMERADRLFEQVFVAQEEMTLYWQREAAKTAAQRGAIALASLRYRQAAEHFAIAARLVLENEDQSK